MKLSIASQFCSCGDGTMMDIKNRIKEFKLVDPRELKKNPKNHHTHPVAQRRALKEAMDSLGWVQPLTLNEVTGNLVDGHARLDEALELNIEHVPVIIVELSEEEEAVALAAIVKTGHMAEIDRTLEADLLAITTGFNADLAALLGATGVNLDPVDENIEVTDEHDPQGISMVPGEQFDYIMLVFRSELDFLAAKQRFGVAKVKDPLSESKKPSLGTGRVIDGAKLLAALPSDFKL